jgi:uncharacterized protein
MEKNQAVENCFIIPIANDFLVYSPLVGVSALINRSGVIELLKQIKLIEQNQIKSESKLNELAFDILQSLLQTPNRKTGDLNPDFLGIIPTRSCNGACNYCDFETEKTPSFTMSYQLAGQSVNWYSEILKSQQRNIMEIHFFGGEPMVARDVIEVVVHKARIVSIANNLIPFFQISTNGQYSVADARFLGQYFNKVILSLDGTKEVQNTHRPLKANRSSFENAVETAKIISSSNAELCIRCCVSMENVFNMIEFTEWLCTNFKLSAINFEILCTTSLTNSVGLYPPDPVDFALNFQKSRDLANTYGVEVIYASDISGQPLVSSCPVGKDTAIVSPDGRISNCYLLPQKWQGVGLDLDFGCINSEGIVSIESDKIDAIRNMVENKPRCSNCFCQWSCAGSCHVGITYPGSSIEYDSFCKQTRLISAFTLLTNLGLPDRITELMLSKSALQKISNQKSDHIQVFNSY